MKSFALVFPPAVIFAVSGLLFDNLWVAIGVNFIGVALSVIAPYYLGQFAVKAGKKVDGKNVWAGTYATINTATKPEAPSGITSAQNKSAIRLSWSGAENITGYRIYYKSGDIWKICVSSTTATSHIFENLKAGARFTFAVKPYIEVDGVVIWGKYTEFTAATKPENVTAKVASPSKGKIALTWNAANGADDYQVYYKTGDGSYKLYKTYTSVQNLTFSSLPSGTKYTFAVRAGIKTSGGNIFGTYTPVTVTVK